MSTISLPLRPTRWSFGRLTTGLLVVWVLTMVGLPVVAWTFGEDALYYGIVAGVLLQAGTVIAILYRAWGMHRTVQVAGMVAVFTWGIEAIGTATGVPFGVYNYTDTLQPQIAHVPLLIPFAWLMMLPPAWAVAQRIAADTRGIRFVVTSALAFTAWDLFLDPQMVAWDLWRWSTPGLYFGIPLMNYAGWIIAAILATLIVRPDRLPEIPLLLIYTITWVLESIGLFFFWGLPGPAVAGFLGMGSILALALYQPREER